MGIKTAGFENGSQHFGATGAPNDVDTPSNGSKMKDLLDAAPHADTMPEGEAGNGEGPRSGFGN